MIPHPKNPTMVLTGRQIVLASSLLIAVSLQGQTAAAPSAAALARYDTNKNGVLDPDEISRMQTDEGRRGEAPITLTPFEVSTTKDVGYAAGNTLSGGRVDTPIALTPGSISVMTKEFLEDFNITNINDAAAWTIGVDGGTSTPNSDSSTEATYRMMIRGAPTDQNFPTRNGSQNFGVADSYNSERFEFQRGPDTAMFGDGGPGGRQSSSSKRARFNSTATSMTAQTDTFGGYRGTFDYNIGWDRIAFRVNALAQNNKAYQDGVNRLKNAATIAMTVKVTKNTEFRAEFERTAEWNNLYSITLGDQSMFWDRTTFNDNNSALLGNTGASLNALGLEQVSATNDYFVYNWGIGELVNYKGNQYRTRGTGHRIPYVGNTHIPASRWQSFPAGIDRKFNLTGKDHIRDTDGDYLAFVVDHRLRDLFLQGSFVRSNYEINTPWIVGNPNEYRVDVNKLLPDGRLNPNFLRPYGDVGVARNYTQDHSEEFRGLATYRFSKRQFFDYKQQLSLNTSYRVTKGERRDDSWRRVDNPLVLDPYSAQNALNFRYYWGDPRPTTSTVLTDPNKVMPGKWVLSDTGGFITERTLKNAALTSQSMFFSDRLALTASVSRDDLAVEHLPRLAAGLAGSTGAPDYKNVLGFGAPGVSQNKRNKVTSTAYGVVAYPFPQRFPWLAPLGFVVNVAENNQAPTAASQAPLITGDQPPLTHSKTLDWGVRYSIPGGKVYLTVTRYNTDQDDVVGGFGSQAEIRNIWLNLGHTDPKLTTNEFNYSDLSSRKLEGWEAELTANPWRTLTLTANYSHPLVYIQSDSVFRQAYVAQHIAEWRAGAALANNTPVPNGGGRTTIDTQLVRDALLAIENSLNGLTSGALENGATKHRINVAARYAFREGRLRGFAFFGGMNYRSHTKSGSRDAQIKFNTTTPTAEQNRQAAFDYLWTPPFYTFSAGANYTRRFGKYQTRFQLNITNLLDNKKPQWGRNTTTGPNAPAYATFAANTFYPGSPRQQQLAGFTAIDPRKITFSTTISF